MRWDHILELGRQRTAVGLGLVAVDDGRESLDRITGDEHVHLDHFRGAIAGVLVVHRAVTTGHRLELVVEIDENFRQRKHAGKHHTGVVDGLGVGDIATFFEHELHHVADVLAGHHDVDIDDRLADFLNHLSLGEKSRVIDYKLGAIGERDLINDRRVGRDHIHVELATQTFLDDLHVQQPEETAAETEAERSRAFLLIGERRIVDLQLAHGRLERLVVRGIDRINPREHHRLDFLVAGQSLFAGVRRIGHRVADLHLAGGLHVGDHIADIAGH